MSEESNLTIRQQRVINKYLSYHFGTRMCVPEIELRKIGNDYVQYESFTQKHDSENLLYYFRSPNLVLINIIKSRMHPLSINEIKEISKEIIL